MICVLLKISDQMTQMKDYVEFCFIIPFTVHFFFFFAIHNFGCHILTNEEVNFSRRLERKNLET